MITPEQMREENLAFLNEHDFKPATWMPLPAEIGQVCETVGFAGGTLRPEIEIAERLCCHCAVFAWGSAPPDFAERITGFIDKSDLRSCMTEDELAIIDLPKEDAREQYANTVGWRLENMWSLAWILGLAEEPSAITGQLPNEITDGLLSLFLPDFEATPQSLVNSGETQPAENVVRMEDLFYLAHNAVRSGQTGHTEQLPEGFHPIIDGGAIHERRHSLTWSLAPGAEWDDTDLST